MCNEFLCQEDRSRNRSSLRLRLLASFTMLLVYGYMPNGSLDQWIFPKIKAFILDWRQRKKIIIDI
ncbi:hypothetical protein NC651_018186 [Populus alba x Populus x berolinensis]|nr:hypothetical protein NC651_018186 [Populus alba x Populus x berolinensis]